MSYKTKYKLEIKNGNCLALIKKLRERKGAAEFALDESGKSPDWFSIGWCEHEKDLKEFSKLYPDSLFILKGEGENNGDLWVKYFKNGLMQHCRAKITFENFDEEKLK